MEKLSANAESFYLQLNQLTNKFSAIAEDFPTA